MGVKRTNRDFIKDAKSVHGDKYDYSRVDYKDNKTKVCIICPEHGEFWQKYWTHITQKSNCPKCGHITGGLKKSRSSATVILKRFIKIHGDTYDYSKVKYVDMKSNIAIICKKHGKFNQSPTNHLSGKGCPKCKNSKGENYITSFLKINSILFECEFKFYDCKNINCLPFDFYLPELNTCIEYDGEQHYIPKKRFGGVKGLNKIQKRDKIKTEYCKKNNIRLLRIRYDENIEDRLSILT